MYPETRGRTSTDSTGSVRPVNSFHSTISRCSTGATVTEGAIGRWGAAFRPQPVVMKVMLSASADAVKETKSLLVIASQVDVFGLFGGNAWIRRPVPVWYPDIAEPTDAHASRQGFVPSRRPAPERASAG